MGKITFLLLEIENGNKIYIQKTTTAAAQVWQYVFFSFFFFKVLFAICTQGSLMVKCYTIFALGMLVSISY